MTTLYNFRQRHPRFVYERYSVSHADDALHFQFHFLLEPDIRFAPTMTIEGVPSAEWERLGATVQRNLAFHLGMAEVLSYWKAAASPQIVIQAGPLTAAQRDWWHDLLINGMGEYFFLNDIDFTAPDFVTIHSTDTNTPADSVYTQQPPAERLLIPVGGGKDSAVTLDILGDYSGQVGTLALNPTPAIESSIARSQSTSTVRVRRQIDPKLLELNAAGYLNGHTPFSSVVAFLSVVCAVIFDYRYIALSNESSSNEGNQRFHGYEVNHQYSKTFDFEQKFRLYSRHFLAQHIEYFSFLRPLYELQIARLFADLTDYHSVFRSCNVGRKTNSWCHNCSKCLFVYTMLYPFLEWEQLMVIFDHDLFTREDLLPIARELAGLAESKPFECVGTHEESRLAFGLSASKYQRRGEPLPFILQALHDEIGADFLAALDARAERLLSDWNAAHALPPHFERRLQQRLAQVIDAHG